MIMLRCGIVRLTRCFSTTASLTSSLSEKAKLKELRKLSGYSFILCKKALKEHDYDVPRANEWLHAQAAAEGWAKMEKLGDRATPQGLVCVAAKKRAAAMVEIKCETDFVARTDIFGQLVRQVATSCLPLAQQLHEEDHVMPLTLDEQVLMQDGRPITELIAESVGRLGEKIELGRALLARAKPTSLLSTYVHPSQEEGALQSGRYGALVVFELFERGRGVLPPHMFGRNLCQHVVGMAPRTIGDYVVTQRSEECEHSDDETKSAGKSDDGDEARNDEGDGSDEEEQNWIKPRKIEYRLLDQEFLADPDYTVREYLAMHNSRIIEFARLECGNNVS